MNAYSLKIKSEISSINNRSLRVFLFLNGYKNVVEKDCGKHCEIPFRTLYEAHEVEIVLRKMFTCFITEINQDLSEGKYRFVNVTSFKENGKYYDNFDITILVDTQEFNLVKALLESGETKEHFIYHGFYANNVPFIIPAHTKASDMKPYVKIGENR